MASPRCEISLTRRTVIMSVSRKQRETSIEDSPIVLLLMLFAVAAIGLYLTVARLHIRPQQLVEGALYLFIVSAALTAPIVRRFAPNAKRKKRPPFVVSAAKDERAVAEAWEK